MSTNSRSHPLTFLCLASYEKGHRFTREAKQGGCRIYLLTLENLRHTARFPHESLDDVFYMPDDPYEWNLQGMLYGVAHLCRNLKVDWIVALDDFDLEKAALLREHFRIPGMGESATRFFCDKLAMRLRAAENGIPVRLPWVLKRRLITGAIGSKKYYEREEVWQRIHSLGDQQSFFALERFVPGDLFHVDSIWFGGEMVTAFASAYRTHPLEVTSDGGKTSERMGGAHIADLIEAGTGVNMWAEWAKVEVAAVTGQAYVPPQLREEYAGLLVSLTRQEWLDTSTFQEPELVWRLDKRHHVGFVVRPPDHGRVSQLLDLIRSGSAMSIKSPCDKVLN